MLATLALLAAVGFEPLFIRDLSRTAISGNAQGRLVPVYVWYPAASGKPMRFGDYVRLAGRYESDARSADTDRLGAERFAAITRELAYGPSTIDKHLPQLLDYPMTAIANAKPAAGRFPIVIFPDYRAPATNSILAERIAAAGFIVISLPLVGSLELDYENSVAGMETAVADIRFALDHVARKPYVDASRVSLIGVGIAANINAAYAARNPDVDALISLDGGIMSPFEVSLMRRTPYFEPAALRAPLLVIESPFEGQDRSLLSDFRYADKTFVRFPTMKEFYYLNYGALEASFPGLLGEAPPRAGEDFEAALRHIITFLRGERVEGTREPARTRVPSYVELKRMIAERGIDSVRALHEQVKKDDPQPFRPETLLALANHFGWRKDEDWKIRHGLMSIYTATHPTSARAHFGLANACRARRDTACAKTHYAETLRLLPNDYDPSIDPAMRQRIETLAKQRMAEAG